MNRREASLLLAIPVSVLQGFSEGREVQHSHDNGKTWRDNHSPNFFCEPPIQWRLKPVPEEIFVAKSSIGNLLIASEATLGKLIRDGLANQEYGIKKFREVIES